MRFFLHTMIAALAAGTFLGGCVAAVVPLVAGGAIAQRELRNGDKTAAVSGEAATEAFSWPDDVIADDDAADLALAGSTYSPFVEHALRFAGKSRITDVSASALLEDPAGLTAERMQCDSLPPAVLIDLDPTDELMPLVAGQVSDPALGEGLVGIRDSGIAVIWISSHPPEAAGRIRDILADTWLDPYGTDPLVLLRFAGESKQARRRALGKSYCLVAIAGDQRADFDELYEYLLDPTMAAPLEVLIGNGWFLTPPPLG